MVRRPRLTRPLSAPAAPPLVTLVAPAGWGKTTLLCDWAERDDRPFAWVTLDPADDDPACLEASIGLAVERVEPQRETGRFVLVLDNLQVLRGPAALASLAAVVDGLPPEVTLALASRTPPALRIARRRTEGRVAELGPADLALDPAEAATLLRLAHVPLGADDVAGLQARTEGWPAALSLGALSLGGGSSPDDAAAFGGADRLLADYVRDEILGDLSADQRRLALETSVLDTLSGPLCDQVLQRSGSAAALSELARERLMLIPIDRTDEHFRHHRVVAEMLGAELRRLEPELASELHRRAGDWYRREGDHGRAVRHAIRTGDVAAAGEMVWRSMPAAVSHGHKHEVDDWLSAFTEAEIAATPTLALAMAGTQIASGQGHLAEHWASTAAGASGSPNVEAGVAIVRATLARDGLDRMHDDAERAYALEPDESPARAMCCLLAGTAAHLAGQDGEAVRQLQEGAHRAAVVAPDVHALCLTQLALVALVREDWEEANVTVTRARAQVERHGLGGYPTAALVFAASALVRARRGRVEQAHLDFRDARRLRAQLTDFAAWYEVELSVVLARAAIRLSDLNAARGLLDDAGRTLRRLPDAARLETWLEEVWAQLDAALGVPSAAPSSITGAELRTLHFLPTHLSFREIAARIDVSANTVKTQANAVYRKLDVTCRSDAVSRARELGLLDG
jgi:LuxR family maltose regulon positive regulatory protein